jgi:hypothetical protein
MFTGQQHKALSALSHLREVQSSFEGRAGLLEFPRISDATDGAAVASGSSPALNTPKETRKLEKKLETRVLDPWERYRVLVDLMESYTDLSEVVDRKTRFGLMIVGALNALNLLVVAKPDLLGAVAPPSKVLIALYVVTYASLSLYLLIQAIGALRPRMAAFLGSGTPEASGLPGLRFMGTIVEQRPEDYYEKWQQLELGQLNREVALHVQWLAGANIAKHRSLNRLYSGLVGLTVLTAALVVTVVFTSLLS